MILPRTARRAMISPKLRPEERMGADNMGSRIRAFDFAQSDGDCAKGGRTVDRDEGEILGL
jgi:hypothetical protein